MNQTLAHNIIQIKLLPVTKMLPSQQNIAYIINNC